MTLDQIAEAQGMARELVKANPKVISDFKLRPGIRN